MWKISSQSEHVALVYFETKSDNEGITCTRSKCSGGKMKAEEDTHPVVSLVPVTYSIIVIKVLPGLEISKANLSQK